MARRGIPEIWLDTADDVNMICRQKTCNLHMSEQLTMVIVVLSSQDKGSSLERARGCQWMMQTKFSVVDASLRKGASRGEGPLLPMDDA